LAPRFGLRSIGVDGEVKFIKGEGFEVLVFQSAEVPSEFDEV